MSRSYHANRKKLQELEKEDWGKNHFNHFLEIKRLKGELKEKAHIKNRSRDLKKVKNILDYEIIESKELISNIRIFYELSDDIIYPVEEQDVKWLLNAMSTINLMNVNIICFTEIEYRNSWDELLLGIFTPRILGLYEGKNDQISINGLKVKNVNHELLPYILFYYKVRYLSTISHEIFHNIDFNTKRYRKENHGKTRKYHDKEYFAYSLQADFYFDKIIPYIKNIYKSEYEQFIKFMKAKGVLPLALEFWSPAKVHGDIHDGMHFFFKNITKSDCRYTINFDFADHLYYIGKPVEALTYCDYILEEITPFDFETLKLKAKIYCTDLADYHKADFIFSEIYYPKIEEDVTALFAYTKKKLNQFNEAYNLYKKIEPLSDWDLIYYMDCLLKLDKHKEFKQLVKKIEAREYWNYINPDILVRELFLMHAYTLLGNYQKSLKYFSLIDFKSLIFYERVMWAKLIASKIYMYYKDFNSAKKALSNFNIYPENNDPNYHLVKRKIKLEKYIRKKLNKI